MQAKKQAGIPVDDSLHKQHQPNPFLPHLEGETWFCKCLQINLGILKIYFIAQTTLAQAFHPTSWRQERLLNKSRDTKNIYHMNIIAQTTSAQSYLAFPSHISLSSSNRIQNHFLDAFRWLGQWASNVFRLNIAIASAELCELDHHKLAALHLYLQSLTQIIWEDSSQQGQQLKLTPIIRK